MFFRYALNDSGILETRQKYVGHEKKIRRDENILKCVRDGRDDFKQMSDISS